MLPANEQPRAEPAIVRFESECGDENAIGRAREGDPSAGTGLARLTNGRPRRGARQPLGESPGGSLATRARYAVAKPSGSFIPASPVLSKRRRT